MYKISRVVIASILILASYFSNAQGINFQGVARSSNGTILASSNISLRLSLLSKSVDATPEYVETKKVVTNAQGIFSIVIGDGVTATVGTFTSINWGDAPKFLKVEMDPSGGTSYISMGITQLQYVPYSFYSLGVAANNVTGVLSVDKGGTGVGTLAGLKTALALDKVNNTADLDKPISTKTQAAIDLISINFKTDKYSNVFFGQNAGNNYQDTYNYGYGTNTAIGVNTLQNNTDYWNVAVGGNALYMGAKSRQNTALGYNSMYNYKKGYDNVAVGYAALSGLDSGIYNTALGTQTLINLKNSNNNTGLGYRAMAALKTGENNLAVGYQAGYSLDSGYNNIFIGTNAGSSDLFKKINNKLIISNVATSKPLIYGSFDSTFLTVNGDLNITGKINTAYGNLNLTDSIGNLRIGNNVLKQNRLSANPITWPTNIKTVNMGIGDSSLYSNTIGAYNIAIGNKSLAFNREGGYNTAIGYGAMLESGHDTSQNQSWANTAIGSTALMNNKFGVGNIAIGSGTIEQGTLGDFNAGFGMDALHFNNGSYNTGIGDSAMSYLNNGNFNTSIGYRSGLALTSGSKNVFIGNSTGANIAFSNVSNILAIDNSDTSKPLIYGDFTNNKVLINGSFSSTGNITQQLPNNTTGINNTSIGSQAINSNTTGSNNTAIGVNALLTNTTGSSNTAIGYNANVASGNLSNTTAIGNGAIATASNTIQLGNTSVTEVKTSGMYSSGKGFLPPKLLASERDAIVSPPTALIIFCKNCGIKGQMQYYDGTAWVDMTGNAAASTLDVGTTFQGGVIAYILQQGDPGYDANVLHGFIAASADLSAATWCNGAYSSTGAVSAVIGAGYSNTTAIVNVQGVGSYAAKMCKDYRGGSYSDWYLPSEDELYKIWLNRVAIGGLGDLSTTSRPYWSSTDYAPVPPAVVSAGARYIEFGNGARNGGDKFSIFRVRPIRSF